MLQATNYCVSIKRLNTGDHTTLINRLATACVPALQCLVTVSLFVGNVSCKYWLASGSNESTVHVHDLGSMLGTCSFSYIMLQLPSSTVDGQGMDCVRVVKFENPF